MKTIKSMKIVKISFPFYVAIQTTQFELITNRTVAIDF